MRGFLPATILATMVLVVGCQTKPAAQQPAAPAKSGEWVDEVAHSAISLFSAPTQDPYLRDWEQAIERVEAHDRKRAYPVLIDLIASERFDELPAPQRHIGLLLAGLVGATLSDRAYAQRLVVRATAMPEAGMIDLHTRANLACGWGDRTDCLISLTSLVRGWPTELSNVYGPSVRQVAELESGDGEQRREARFQLLNALFDAHFAISGIEPDDLWEDLVEALVQRGDVERAARVVMRINSPRQLLALRVDRRFDALVKHNPSWFDLQAACRREVETHQRAVRNAPRNLYAIAELTSALNEVGRYQEVLRLTQSVMSRVAAVGDLKSLYDDGPAQLVRLLQFRAQALQYLGRWGEAEEEMESSANHLDNGRRNVNFVIDLAIFYVNWGRSDAARDMLSYVPTDAEATSPFGKMLMYAVRLRIGLLTHDEVAMQTSLTYLHDHQQDEMDTYESALVATGHLDDAASLLVTRLQAPATRTVALLAVQHYLAVGTSPLVRQANDRWQEIANRREVKAAIDALGRRETVPLSP